MDLSKGAPESSEESDALRPVPSFIWPDSRILAKCGEYAARPPGRELFADAELISGLLVGVADKTVEWLKELSKTEGKTVRVVIVLSPAGPTRQEHLSEILHLSGSSLSGQTTLEVRLLTMDRAYAQDFERAVLPPTVIQGYTAQDARTVMSIGSVGDAGCDEAVVGSTNFVFYPDDGLRDAWRMSFQYLFSSAGALTAETAAVPDLVPARGTPEAADRWEAFKATCGGGSRTGGDGPSVDPKTGEVFAEPDGRPVVVWDEGKTALDPLAQELQRVYAGGWLVTIDEATRLRPLTIPVKATLLGQQSRRAVGAVRQKQSFSLQVLDDAVDMAVEKCRKVTGVFELLTCQLSQGNRWLPHAARRLLDQELESRDERGRKTLCETLGGRDVQKFVLDRADAIRKDLNEMYRQLGQGSTVPDDKLETVLHEVTNRLSEALATRITPRAVYNRLGPPELAGSAPDENWNQPLALLIRSARILRESATDRYFPRRFSGLSFSEEDFMLAFDPFGDSVAKTHDWRRAARELDSLDAIMSGQEAARAKCQAVWRLIRNTE